MAEQLGKINRSFFEDTVFQHSGKKRREILAGPMFGVDVALVSLPNGLAMAMTSDPLSLIPSLGLEESAWLSVHLMANDMATTGSAPQYGQFVLNLPSTFSKHDFKTYWQYIDRFCKEIDVAITGGHTGFIEGQNSTIAGGGTFTTVAEEKAFRLSCYAQEGDVLLVTKECALSSSAILALSFPETVRNRIGKDRHEQACEAFYQTSSLKDALTAVAEDEEHKQVSAMHDVTEGGVLGAVYEMAVAAGLGVVIDDDNLPVRGVSGDVCQIFDLDPRYCVGAGAMLIACKAEAKSNVISKLTSQAIACTEIGVFTQPSQGMKIKKESVETKLEYQPVDPYWHAFLQAYKKGWK